MSPRRRVVSVVGDARLEDPARYAEAQQLGAALVRGGFRVVTGGLGGVMEAVSRGAREAPEWREGMVVGVLPSYRGSDANPWCDIVIPTGMQLARNVLVVSMGDVVVALGGGAGTLSEIALAWQLGRPILTLGATGWSGKLCGASLDARSDGIIRGCSSVSDVVAACHELAAERREPGDVGSGWRALPNAGAP